MRYYTYVQKQEEYERKLGVGNKLSHLNVIDLKTVLLGILQEEETVTGALKRLSANNRKFTSTGTVYIAIKYLLSIVYIAQINLNLLMLITFLGKGRNRKAAAKELDVDPAASTVSTADGKEQLAKLIDCADMLLSKGILSIYDSTYEAISNSLSLWEYQALDGSLQGPFDSQQILAWKGQGYFTGPTAVNMRRCGHVSEAQVSVGIAGEKRKSNAFDAASGASKKVKLDVPAKSQPTNHEDLLADLDDDEPAAPATAQPTPIRPVAAKPTKGPWISSDDIDFGQLITSVSAGAFSSSDGGIGGGTRSSSVSFGVSSTNANLTDRRDDTAEGDEDDEDGDDDEEEEGEEMNARQKKRAVRFQLKTTGPDSDEDD